MNKESYRLSANVQKIDSECLQWFMAEQKISIRELARRTGNSHQTVNRWMKRGEMPAYLIEEICEALALESVCDMRENSVLKCAEPVTTFQWREQEENNENVVTMHVMITMEIKTPKRVFEQLLKYAVHKPDLGYPMSMDDLSFDNDTAEIVLAKGKLCSKNYAGCRHYISGDQLLVDAARAGYIKNGELIFTKEDSKNED